MRGAAERAARANKIRVRLCGRRFVSRGMALAEELETFNHYLEACRKELWLCLDRNSSLLP